MGFKNDICLPGQYQIHTPIIFFIFQGGYKAVIWTDVFQALIMYSGVLIVLIKACIWN